MRIAVSSDDDRGLDSPVSRHFGRCPFFILVDVREEEIIASEAVRNPFYESHSPGQVPSFVVDLGAQVMLAGGMGRRAIDAFSGAGIECVSGVSGTVRSVVETFLSGKSAAASPCRESIEHSSGTESHTRLRPNDATGRLTNGKTKP